MKRCARRRGEFVSARGFTLVELMVALTGGLLISVFVFMMASQGSQFYQQEARISNATIGVMNGFQRLRTDIARAGFLASPNVVQDSVVCSDKSAAEGWVPALQSLYQMGGVRIDVDGSLTADEGGKLGGFWEANGLKPDQLILAGAFSSTDQFPAAEISQPNPGGAPRVWRVYLQPNSPAMARLGYRTDGTQGQEKQSALIEAAFASNAARRVLRILDKKGSHHYAVIGSVGLEPAPSTGQPAPFIQLTADLTLRQESRTSKCGLQGLNVGATVNVVNFIRYGLKSLNDPQEYPEFAALYTDEVKDTHEETRAELVREEVDVDGTPIPETRELVAEYAVDLRFSLSVLRDGALLEVPEGSGDLALYAGDPQAGARPEWIRSVHARLAVRSREADRKGNLDPASAGVPPLGLYRVGFGEDGTGPFARVRTLQADIALRNHMRTTGL